VKGYRSRKVWSVLLLVGTIVGIIALIAAAIFVIHRINEEIALKKSKNLILPMHLDSCMCHDCTAKCWSCKKRTRIHDMGLCKLCVNKIVVKDAA
jgi:hypothetical protein